MNAHNLTVHYDSDLVVLSVIIAILAAYAALDLAGRLTNARSGSRFVWLCGGAVAMGNGIWAMHYIGMEAFQLPVQVNYDWPTVLLSLLAAIVASAAALFTVSRNTMGYLRMIVGGIFMGCGIASMHYIGMRAMRLPATCSYSPWLVLLSIALAIGISIFALRLTFALRQESGSWTSRKVLCAIIMGMAIPVMHYVGLTAANFTSLQNMNGSMAHAIDVSHFAIAGVAIVTGLILGVVYLTSIIDRRFTLQSQRLAASERQLQTIFDNVSEGLLVLDRRATIVFANRAGLRLLSISGQINDYREINDLYEIVSENGDLIPLESWPSMRALRGEYVQDQPILFRRKSDGEVAAREVSTAPMTGGFGDSIHIIITFRDVTERRKVEEARERLAAIVDSSEDAIISKTEFGIVQSWNNGATRLFGYSADEMVGQSITLLLPDDRAGEEDLILSRIRRGEIVDHIETERKTKSGQLIHVSLTISPIRDSRGRIVGASKIARNITERKHLERQLYQSQKMEAIGQLTGGIAHDFNNLLGIILGNLDLLEVLLEKNVDALKRVKTAQSAAVRGADLIRRLMSFSSNIELRARPTSLNDSVRHLIDWAPALGPDIRMSLDLDESLPLAFIDDACLESSLLNLAVNARDAMPRGGALTVSTHLTVVEEGYLPFNSADLKSGRYACVCISDTGHGMSKETLDRVFEPFFTTKAQGKGTGLGLAMVYGFAKQSGGTVRIYSEVGFGTTVTLYLPLAEEAIPPLAAVTEHSLPTRLSGSVLIVDDEETLVEIAKAYIEDMGYAAYHAVDGPSALALVDQHREIDLLITDILMPGGMNGVELADKIRQSLREIKVIYCSGFSANALAERDMALTNGRLLHKPYQRAEFTSAVRSVMEG